MGELDGSTIGASAARGCQRLQISLSRALKCFVKLSGTPPPIVPATLNKRVCGHGAQLQQKQTLSVIGALFLWFMAYQTEVRSSFVHCGSCFVL